MNSRAGHKGSAVDEACAQQKPGRPRNDTAGLLPGGVPLTAEKQPATHTIPDCMSEDPPPEPHDTRSTAYSSLGRSASEYKQPSTSSDIVSIGLPRQATQKRHRGPTTSDFSTTPSKSSSTTDLPHGPDATQTSNTNDAFTKSVDNQHGPRRLQRRYLAEDCSPTTQTSYTSALSGASRLSTRRQSRSVLKDGQPWRQHDPAVIKSRPQWYKRTGQGLAATAVGSVSKLLRPRSRNNSPDSDPRSDVPKPPVSFRPPRSFTLRRKLGLRPVEPSSKDAKGSLRQAPGESSTLRQAGGSHGARLSKSTCSSRMSPASQPGLAAPADAIETAQLYSSLGRSLEKSEVQVSVVGSHPSASPAPNAYLSPSLPPEMETPTKFSNPARRRALSCSSLSSKFSSARSELSSIEERSFREEEVIESIREAAEAGRLSVDPVPGHTPYLTASDKKGAVVTLLTSCAVGIIMYILVLLKTSLLRTQPGGAKACDSFDCREHALHIGIVHRRSQLDPCEDFGRFVCASWQPRYILTRTVTEEVAVDWAWNLAAPRSRHENVASSSVADQVQTMSSLCVDKGAADQPGSTRRLHAFMKAQDLLWPDDIPKLPGNSAKPLRSLVNLAVKWRLPLWFNVDLISSNNARNRSIFLTPSRIAVLWNHLLDHVELSDTYPKVLAKEVYQKSIKSSSWPKGPGEKIHRSIVRNLSHSGGMSDVTAQISNVAGVADVMEAFSPQDWAEALQHAFNASPPIAVEDAVLVSDFSDIKLVGRLFSVHTPRDVMAHVSWWVAQILGSLTNRAVLKAMQMSDPLETAFHVVFCSFHIDSAYNILLTVADRERTSTQQRTSAKQFLEKVFNITASIVLQSRLLADDIKTALRSTIYEASTIIWPDDQYSDELTRLHGNFAYGAQEGFFDAWYTSRQIYSQIYQRHLSRRPRWEMAEISRATSSSTLTSHNAALKTIYVSPAAFSPPFYYTLGTSAMMFGGLGFLYARETLRLLGLVTHLYGPLRGAPACREQGLHLLNDLPALQAAFAAYQMYRSDAEDARLIDLEKYAPIQIFLITACHAMCETRNATKFSPRCTFSMRNFRPFALAFACPLGSPMNPSEKCDFFS